MSALSFVGVNKRFGKALALDNLSFEVPVGAVCGFIGPNGAGKTTSFSVVSGFLVPDSGTVDILGQGPFDPYALKGRLGVLPQDAALPDRHTPLELVTHVAKLSGVKQAKAESARVLEMVRLGDRMNARIATLSHGMRRRVAVASAMVGSPELVLLDEPMAGLDPVQAQSLRDTLKAAAGTRTLIVSSHNLDELEKLCDWVVMIDKGRMLRQGTIEDVTGRGQLVRWQLGSEALDLATLRSLLPDHALRMDGADLVQEAPNEASLDSSSLVIMRHLAASGVAVRGVRRGLGLEQRFLDDAARH